MMKSRYFFLALIASIGIMSAPSEPAKQSQHITYQGEGGVKTFHNWQEFQDHLTEKERLEKIKDQGRRQKATTSQETEDEAPVGAQYTKDDQTVLFPSGDPDFMRLNEYQRAKILVKERKEARKATRRAVRFRHGVDDLE